MTMWDCCLLAKSTSQLSGAPRTCPCPSLSIPQRLCFPLGQCVIHKAVGLLQGCHCSQYLSNGPWSDGSVGLRSMKMVGGSAGLLRR